MSTHEKEFMTKKYKKFSSELKYSETQKNPNYNKLNIK